MTVRFRLADDTRSIVYDLTGTGAMKATMAGALRVKVGEMRWEERWPVVLSGTAAQKMSAVQTIDDYARRVREYHTKSYKSQAIWLEEAAEGEDTERRALVYRMELMLNNTASTSRQFKPGDVKGQLLMEVGPWEAYTARSESYNSVITPGSSVISIANNEGDLNGRISKLTLYNAVLNGSTFWIGISGDDTGADPVFLRNPSYLGTDTTIIASGEPTFDGRALNVSFATDASMVTRYSVPLSDFAGLPANQNKAFGRFLVLIGYRTTSFGTGTVMRAQLAGPTAVNPQKVSLPDTVTPPTQYFMTELGVIELPGREFRSYADFASAGIGNLTIDIQVERLAGTGGVRFDTLLLLPIDALIRLINPGLDSSGKKIYIYTWPTGVIQVVRTDASGAFEAWVDFESLNWSMPGEEDVSIAFSGRRTFWAFLSAGDTIDMDLEWHPRWSHYMGEP